MTLPAPPATTTPISPPSTKAVVKKSQRKIVCVVPHLVGQTLAEARTALTKAHCALGAVHRPKHVSREHVLHVKSESATPGTKHASHFAVGIRLK